MKKVTILGKEYRLNTKYYRKLKLYDFEDFLKVAGVLEPAFLEIVKSRNIKNDNGVYEAVMVYNKYYHLYTYTAKYKGRENYDYNNLQIYFIIRDKFDWPKGYFHDESSCWHDTNMGAPYMVLALGGYFIQIYYKQGEEYKPLSRSVIFPDGAIGDELLVANTKSKYIKNGYYIVYNEDVLKLFTNNAIVTANIKNDGRSRKNKNILYFDNVSASLNSTSNFNARANNTSLHYSVNIPDEPYYCSVCEECYEKNIYAYKLKSMSSIKHKHGTSHIINNRRYK